MKYFKLAMILFSINGFGFHVFGQNSTPGNDALQRLFRDSLPTLVKRIENRIMSSRYMEKIVLQETDTLEGWKGYMVKLYEYKFNAKVPSAKVYMLNANSQQVAKWIISACYRVTGRLD
ncbi:hypothetical protein [Flavisolibacter nicotianae]|uniref:hypothetical protein n=1 Tax=Flavisolibacter nicotianae TaxID=2364882 RepID=UPI0013C460E4|nr:hypothetical protein [Flavisolibacter nicotianae]